MKNILPTAQELFELFTQINNEINEEFEVKVPLSDNEYYAKQIQNIYNCTDKEAEQLALKLKEISK